MKKIILASLTLLLASGVFAQTPNGAKLSLSSSKVTFFSSTPVENIDATSTKIDSRLDLSRNVFVFVIQNTTFQFKNKLMQEHFNEKYMESEKYPSSTFSGKINEAVDLSKDGEYNLTVTGKLKIHGVEMDRTIPVKATVKGGKISFVSEFKVKVADHKIEIPTLVMAKIAEEVTVKIEGTF